MITPPVTHFVNNGLQRAVFTPLSRLVSNVTNAKQAVVTTTVAHGFTTGQSIRLFVPNDYGMAVNQRGVIDVVNDTSFSIDIDTIDLLAFSAPTAIPNTPTAFTPAQAIADSGTWNNIGAP